jgi:hypothetical protein
MLIIKTVLPMRFFSFQKCLFLCNCLLVTAAALLFGACGDSGGSSSKSAAAPVVEGAIEGSPTLLGTTSFNLSEVGYQQSEYFISGEARGYTYAQAPESDGKWSVRTDGKADYKTRILVYRPIDAAAFNGTVVIEWLNVSSGTEASSVWIMAHTELLRKGYAWVGVSAQKAGIDGGGVNLGGLALHLKAVNPARYESLLHPGDKYAFDMFSQAARSVLQPGGIDPLAGLHVEHAIAAGESQSADFLVTYLNALAPNIDLFDGYFIHSRIHGTVGLDLPDSAPAEINIESRTAVHVRDDLDVPVMMVQTETDMFLLGAYPDRQPDAANFRVWEVAGAAHADLYVAMTGMNDRGDDADIAAVTEVAVPNPIISCGKPVNAGPQHFVVKAALAALHNWVRDGVAPAHADPLEITAGDSPEFVYDSVGNVLGGVRTPYVDVAVAKLSGEGQEGSVLCSLFGTTELFDSAQLAGLYPDHATYVAQVNASVDSAVEQGFLLQPDGDLIKTSAQDSTIGNP